MSLFWANTEPVVTPKKNLGIYSDDEDYNEVFYTEDNTDRDSIDTLNDSTPSLIELFEEAEHQYYTNINKFIEESFNFIYDIPRSTKILLIVLLFQDRIYDLLYNYGSN